MQWEETYLMKWYNHIWWYETITLRQSYPMAWENHYLRKKTRSGRIRSTFVKTSHSLSPFGWHRASLTDTVAITVWLLFNGPTPFPTRNLKKKSCLTHGSTFRSTLTLLKSHFALVVRFLFDGDLLLHSLLLIPPSLTGVISTLAWTLLPSMVPEEHQFLCEML